LRGATTCVKHGAGAPQVRAAAQARILGLVDPSLGALARALRSDDPAGAVRAAGLVLRLAGVEAHVVTADEYARQLRGLLRALLAEVRDPVGQEAVRRAFRVWASEAMAVDLPDDAPRARRALPVAVEPAPWPDAAVVLHDGPTVEVV